MEQTDTIIALLDLIPAPGFCVQDGRICHINPAAAYLPIRIQDSIYPFLQTGTQEYQTFQSGVLSLRMAISSDCIDASVIHTEQMDLFLLEQEAEQNQLQSLALAAQHLRQPLTGVLTGIENVLARQTANTAEERAQTAKLNLSLHQLLRIVYNMSDAYLYSQKPITQMEKRNISNLFNELFEKSAVLIEATGIHLHYAGLTEPIYGFVDAEKLERAVENLLANAVKYSPVGSTINARFTAHDNLLFLTIEDHGEGIGEDIRKNLYTRFLRQPGIGDFRDGIGLGMTLVRSIATLHGGTLMVQPAKDRGTRFTMSLSIQDHSDIFVRSPMLHIDYTGGRDPMMLELSEVLPWHLYE